MESEWLPAAADPVTGPEGGPAGTTGDPRVDEAVAGLAALGERPLEEHPQALEAVHDKLREILGELGEPGRPGRPGLQGELSRPAGQGGPGQGGPGQDGSGGRR